MLPSLPEGVPEAPEYPALRQRLAERLSADELRVVDHAYRYAAIAHAGQRRSSGQPYITHPVAVTSLVADMNLDFQSLAAALMHDVLEDTEITKEALADSFDATIADIVDGLSKLNTMEFRSREEAQNESLRKMLLAMVSDLRVILIKLADRLHNMRTLDALKPDKRKRISRETLDVYAPIAHRLGMFSVKSELEELAFAAFYPLRSRILQHTVGQAQAERSYIVGRIREVLEKNLADVGIEASVVGREKHSYSLYRKMRKKQLSFNDVFDVHALRIVVEDIDTCYRTLGVCHRLYAPIPGRVKDYIAVPKENGYQSLHTNVTYLENQREDGVPVEIQIRTRDMDEFAESGIAAHWIYRNGEASVAERRTHKWLTGLVELQKSTRDIHDFVEQVKVDLFPNDIFVFTPKGEIIRLPANATPVDFAYAVHSQVGNSCVSAHIDNKLSALSTPLESGQTIRINTAPTARPNPMWLNFVVTARARTGIRYYLRTLGKEQALRFGKRLVNRALDRHGLELDAISPQVMDSLLSEYHHSSMEELFCEVGLGNQLASQIAERLVRRFNGSGQPGVSESEVQETPPTVRESDPLVIDGKEGSVLSPARCCQPIPGDDVHGLITAGQGILVHRAGCRQVRRSRRRAKEWIPVVWGQDLSGDYVTSIITDLHNKPGVLAQVSSVISSLNSNIEGMDFDNKGEDTILIRFVLSVSDRAHLARILRRVRNLPVVRRVQRET